MSILSDMNIATPAFFWFLFSWNNFFYPLILSVLDLKWIYCRQQVYGSCFCIQSASLCLLVVTFNTFIVKIIIDMHVLIGLPRLHSGKKKKKKAWQCRRCKICEFNPLVKKIFIPVFIPGKVHRQRNLAGYSPWGCKESDTIEHRQTYTLILLCYCIHHFWFVFVSICFLSFLFCYIVIYWLTLVLCLDSVFFFVCIYCRC